MSKVEDRDRLVVLCYPKKLVVKGRPELRVFPLQVAIVGVTFRDSRLVAGLASYVPDLATYTESGSSRSLRYDHLLDAACTLHITHDTATGSYLGEKVIHGRQCGLTAGNRWEEFFERLSAGGLSNGEPCEFHEVGGDR